MFQSSEIYGGIRSAYDYGPLGVELLRNVKEQWWRSLVQQRNDVVGLDSAIIQARAVWRASGHEEVFTDPMVECRNCNTRHRLDKLEDPEQCPSCGKRGTFTERSSTSCSRRTWAPSRTRQPGLSPARDGPGHLHQLRERGGQRMKLPFRIARSANRSATGHAGAVRVPDPWFEQMEMDFLPPRGRTGFTTGGHRFSWYTDLGIDPGKLRLRPHTDELSHYSAGAFDIEFLFPGAGTSSRASPTAPTTTSNSTPSTPARISGTSTGRPTSGSSPT